MTLPTNFEAGRRRDDVRTDPGIGRTLHADQNEAEKEQIKALANFFNLIGVGFITVGMIAPTIGILREIIVGTGLDLSERQIVEVASLLIASAVGGILFRLGCHVILARLRTNSEGSISGA